MKIHEDFCKYYWYFLIEIGALTNGHHCGNSTVKLHSSYHSCVCSSIMIGRCGAPKISLHNQCKLYLIYPILSDLKLLI